MSLAKTTTAAAIAAGDKTVLLTSIAGLSAGQTIQIDGEKMRVLSVPSAATTPVPVFRGIEGSSAVAHASGANAVSGDAADFNQNFDPARRRGKKSYSASGAIDMPDAGSDLLVQLNGTGALAMTLAAPPKNNDGDVIYIVGNGKAAHTVTVAGGVGAAGTGYDVLTFASGAQNGVALIASNEVWVPLQSLWGGTATAITVTGA
jgi:hypothetical protein